MTTEQKTMRASFLPIVSKCPGAMHSSEGITIREDIGQIARGGQAVHKVCEQIILTANRPEDLSPYVDEYGCDPDFLGRSTWYALQFWREFRGAFPEPITESAMSAPFGKFTLTGHTDVLSVLADMEAKVLDWKAGFRTDVDAEPQMRGYAYLAGHKYQVPKLSATVVWLADQTHQTWTWTWEELQAWAEETARRIEQWDGEYTVGDHCRYCPRFFNCPAQKAIMQVVVEDLALLDEKPGDIEPADMGRLYPTVQNVERLCQVFRDLARRAIEVSGPVPMEDGMELALVTSSRDTIKPLAAWPVIAERLDDAEFAGCIKVSKTKLLKAIAAKAPQGQKAIEKDALMTDLRNAEAVTSKEIKSLRVVRSEKELTTAKTEGE